MNKTEKNLNKYFKNDDLTTNPLYSEFVVKSLIRSILEPLTRENNKALVFTRLKGIDGIEGLVKRLEYLVNINMKQFSDFEFSKYDVDEIGFIVLTTHRYNCAFLFKKQEDNKYEIYLKMNSKLVSNVYETLKAIFLIDYDEEFYERKPERRDNLLMNFALNNILKYFEETIEEAEYKSQIQETYKNVNTLNSSFRNEIYQNTRQIAHEIKNQLSILDIYTRILEKKYKDETSLISVKNSIEVIKKQLNQFKEIDVVNLQEENIKEIIQNSIQTYAEILKEKNNKLILIDEAPTSELNSFADKEKLSIVINNIIKNANDSTEDDEIIIRISQDENKAKISIINHGEKIEEANKEKIFDNGYTTKKDGWGVGLAVCKKYIGSQFGTFQLEKSDENETVFTVLLPLIQIK